MTANVDEPGWPACGYNSSNPGEGRCGGRPVEGLSLCWAHLGNLGEFEAALEGLSPGADFDGRGTHFEAGHVRRILEAVTEDDEEGVPVARFGKAMFAGATFAGGTDFSNVAFEADANFDGAMFAGEVTFNGFFDGDTTFAGAKFEADANFETAGFYGCLNLSRAVFSAPLILNVWGRELDCRRTSFTKATLHVRTAQVDLDDVLIDQALVVAGILLHSEEGVERARIGWSLRQVDASKLTLSGLDLSTCRFAEALHLDQLRTENGCTYARSPGWPWYARRRVLLEEFRLRAEHSRFWRRKLNEPYVSMHIERPDRIAEIYRRLRKAQEDAHNEPGAADFYYGEMEMRRRAASTPIAEKAWLFVYWLVAGYGLRASRSLAALLLLLVLGVVGFATIGFTASDTQPEYKLEPSSTIVTPPTYRLEPATAKDPDRWTTAVDHTLDSATALLRSPQSQPLTLAGRVIEVALRMLGPLLLGLTVLAIRNRVKR